MIQEPQASATESQFKGAISQRAERVWAWPWGTAIAYIELGLVSSSLREGDHSINHRA